MKLNNFFLKEEITRFKFFLEKYYKIKDEIADAKLADIFTEAKVAFQGDFKEHSYFSPSSAAKIMQCKGYNFLKEKTEASKPAKLGHLGHLICCQMFLGAQYAEFLGVEKIKAGILLKKNTDAVKKLMAEFSKEEIAEVEAKAKKYLDKVYLLLSENSLNYGDCHFEEPLTIFENSDDLFAVSGTPDLIIENKRMKSLMIIDFKFGKVPLKSMEQLILYGFGALKKYDYANKCRFIVLQDLCQGQERPDGVMLDSKVYLARTINDAVANECLPLAYKLQYHYLRAYFFKTFFKRVGIPVDFSNEIKSIELSLLLENEHGVDIEACKYCANCSQCPKIKDLFFEIVADKKMGNEFEESLVAIFPELELIYDEIKNRNLIKYKASKTFEDAFFKDYFTVSKIGQNKKVFTKESLLLLKNKLNSSPNLFEKYADKLVNIKDFDKNMELFLQDKDLNAGDLKTEPSPITYRFLRNK